MRQKSFLLDISNIHTFLHSQYIARKHTSRDVMVSTAFLTSVHIPCKNFSSSSNFGKHHDGCVLSSNCICLSSSSTMALTRLSSSRRKSTLARALISLRSKYQRYFNFALFSSLMCCPFCTAFLFPSLTDRGTSIPSSGIVEAEAPAEDSEELNIEGPATGTPGIVLKRAARAALPVVRLPKPTPMIEIFGASLREDQPAFQISSAENLRLTQNPVIILLFEFRVGVAES